MTAIFFFARWGGDPAARSGSLRNEDAAIFTAQKIFQQDAEWENGSLAVLIRCFPSFARRLNLKDLRADVSLSRVQKRMPGGMRHSLSFRVSGALYIKMKTKSGEGEGSE